MTIRVTSPVRPICVVTVSIVGSSVTVIGTAIIAITVVGTTIIAITIIWIARADNNADARTQPHQPQPADAFVGVSAMSAIAKAPTRQTLPFSFISSYVESPVLANNTGLLIDHSI